MITEIKKTFRHRSVRLLILALLLATLSTLLVLPAQAKMFSEDVTKSASDAVRDVGDAAQDIGDAVGHAGDAVKNTVEDMADMDGDGRVRDGDGIIGNENAEQDSMPSERGSMGWVGLVVALVIAVAIISLIIVLVPDKRRDY